ncbi:MAG TPA: hypothetical protein VMU34_02275 [Mycobacterium sp.]|nr:hypothetical protein [Mycobacterium sp.]
MTVGVAVGVLGGGVLVAVAVNVLVGGTGVLVLVEVGGGGGLVAVLVGSSGTVFVGVLLPAPGVTILQLAALGLEKHRPALDTSPMLTTPLPLWSQLGQFDNGKVAEKILPQRDTSPIVMVPLSSQSPQRAASATTAEALTAATTMTSVATVFMLHCLLIACLLG